MADWLIEYSVYVCSSVVLGALEQRPHGERTGGEQWSKVQLQTFFTGPKSAVHYFCVTVAEAAVEAEVQPIGGGDRGAVGEVAQGPNRRRRQARDHHLAKAGGGSRCISKSAISTRSVAGCQRRRMTSCAGCMWI